MLKLLHLIAPYRAVAFEESCMGGGQCSCRSVLEGYIGDPVKKSFEEEGLPKNASRVLLMLQQYYELLYL